MNRPTIDHGILSPSGRVSKRAREAALERTRIELFELLRRFENCLTVGEHLRLDQITTEICETLDYNPTDVQRTEALIKLLREKLLTV